MTSIGVCGTLAPGNMQPFEVKIRTLEEEDNYIVRYI